MPRNLIIRVGIDASDYNKGMDKLKAKAESTGQSVSSIRACLLHGLSHGNDVSNIGRKLGNDHLLRVGLYLCHNLGCRIRTGTEDDALKVKMLTDFTVRFRGTTAVPDPYYGTDADFDHALDLIEDACAGLLETL